MSQRLNIGSGPHYMPGWVNVDRYAEDADVICDAFKMPFDNNVFERAYLGHVLEHIPLFDVPRLLDEVVRVCRPDALIGVVGPCIEKARTTVQPRWLIEQIRRSPTPETPGGGHEWTATTELYGLALEAAGLIPVEHDVRHVSRPDWPNTETAPWQCAFIATLKEVKSA